MWLRITSVLGLYKLYLHCNLKVELLILENILSTQTILLHVLTQNNDEYVMDFGEIFQQDINTL